MVRVVCDLGKLLRGMFKKMVWADDSINPLVLSSPLLLFFSSKIKTFHGFRLVLMLHTTIRVWHVFKGNMRRIVDCSNSFDQRSVVKN